MGYETALALAQAGATVVLTGRDADKAAQAMAQIRSICPAARIGFELLDMASLASIAAFAGRQDARIDILVNNAGVMALPRGAAPPPTGSSGSSASTIWGISR